MPQGREETVAQVCARPGCTEYVRHVSPSDRARGKGWYCTKVCAKAAQWDAVRAKANREGFTLNATYIESVDAGILHTGKGAAPGGIRASCEPVHGVSTPNGAAHDAARHTEVDLGSGESEGVDETHQRAS